MRLFQTRSIKKYKPILEGLISDFGYTYYHSILAWCGIVSKGRTDFWEVWLIEDKKKVVGICGLYSLHGKNYTRELWLGWFGILPELRNRKLGEKTLKILEKEAKSLGCTRILSYVDSNGKPLPFYYRNGYKKISTVKEYLSSRPNVPFSGNFEKMDDVVIYKDLR